MLNTIEMNGKIEAFFREIQKKIADRNLRTRKHNIWNKILLDGLIAKRRRERKKDWRWNKLKGLMARTPALKETPKK